MHRGRVNSTRGLRKAHGTQNKQNNIITNIDKYIT